MDADIIRSDPIVSINPIVAPVNTFTPTSTNINISYDQDLSEDKKAVLNVLFTSLITGSTAMVLGESPLYFGSLGALMAALKRLRPDDLASLSPGKVGKVMSSDTMLLVGGVLLSNVTGKSILSSAIILGAGAYLGPVL